MKQQRYITSTQFLSACKAHGIEPEILGYYRVTKTTCVWAQNAGTRRRDQLDYLLQKQAELQEVER